MSLEDLKRERKAIKAALTRQETTVGKFQDDDVSEADSRIATITDLMKRYDAAQTKIEYLELKDITSDSEESALDEIHNNERLKIENQYHAILAKIALIVKRANPEPLAKNASEGQTVVNITGNAAEKREQCANLKPIPLPNFTGKYSEWFTFIDSFESLIQNNSTLTDIEKFHYLRGCLKDEALRAIESLVVSNANYTKAIELLRKRFENKRLIVFEHVSNIINTTAISKAGYQELRQLIDNIHNNIAALEVLKINVENWDPILVPLLTEKLDYATKREWQATLDKELPTFNEFIQFLEKRCRILESMSSTKVAVFQKSKQATPQNPSGNYQNQYHRKYNKFAAHVVARPNSCVICKKNHNINQCDQFLRANVTTRLNHVKQLNLCLNCLRDSHAVEQCRLSYSCKICSQRHHSLLHVNEFTPSTSALHATVANQILLSTVSILIKDGVGRYHECRALLDQGSQANIISRDLCKKLKLATNKVDTVISGINSAANKVQDGAKTTIKSRVREFEISIQCFVVPKITDLTPAISFDKSKLQLPPNILLADPNFHISSKIDLLIGAEVFWNLLIGNVIHLGKNQPSLQETLFGWVIGGKLITPVISEEHLSCNLVSNNVINSKLHAEMQEFFNEEPNGEGPSITLEQAEAENHYKNTTIRTESGRFQVKLPFKEATSSLGDSRQAAFRQFINLEKRLNSNDRLKTAYKKFMDEYLELNHMELVPISQLDNPASFYLPHHPVFKQTPEGPKIRVVFNGSFKSRGLSLNDILITGPTIQQDLFSILCRFRTYQYALSADITKMYRMILVDPIDANYQRLFWREQSTDPIQIYRLKTVTYGLTSSPFLAVRCLKQLALECKHSNPLASEIIDRDFYMDDLLTGSNSIEQAISIKNQVSGILASGGFNLDKWASNYHVGAHSNSEYSDNINLINTDEVKVLGFYWNCKGDHLKYQINISPIMGDKQCITKRSILSTVAKIFDPLGLVNPVIVKAKLLLQQVWALKIDWDKQVPQDISQNFINLVNELQGLKDFGIPRKLIECHPAVAIELHGFADASSKAYGAAIYVRAVDTDGRVSVQLLCSKSRVAPLNQITLPRLELNAAVLLAHLVVKVEGILNLAIKGRYFWTDSTIVLAWLAEPPAHWKQYIANRVSQIQKVTKTTEWHHVRSAQNPADVVSRGMLPRQLNKSKLWWYGPEWLIKNSDHWPCLQNDSHGLPVSRQLLERKSSATVNLIQTEPELPVITKFSSFSKLQRVIAYCLRFINNCKSKTRANNNKPLVIEELNAASVAIFKHIQIRAFPAYLDNARKNLISNKLARLDPFVDGKGLLRVGGRLKHAPLDYDKKFPIILPDKHHVTKLIVSETHKRELHAGNEATLAAVRQRFWPLSARNVVRKIVYSCVRCRRASPRELTQKMGDLPKERLQPLRPFYISGVDYAGPFLIKEGRTRNARKVKAYVALFICFSTKAVHLELVGNLTSESFVAAFKRFTARRGNVAELFSDNGSNFVGAERELFRSQGFQNQTWEKLAATNTKFHFIPARSPHFGGLWERAVRSVKYHLRRVLSDASLNFEEFYTLLTGIEACLNSRPITPLSPNPNDLDALTPGHFLIGAPLTAAIEVDLTEITPTRLSRWQRIQQLQQHFWQRWRQEYLAQLQARPKGQEMAHNDVTVGTLVVLVEDNLPPRMWKLGRILETHPGSDGVVRVVTVKTMCGVYKRALKKVCVIPTEP